MKQSTAGPQHEDRTVEFGDMQISTELLLKSMQALVENVIKFRMSADLTEDIPAIEHAANAVLRAYEKWHENCEPALHSYRDATLERERICARLFALKDGTRRHARFLVAYPACGDEVVQYVVLNVLSTLQELERVAQEIYDWRDLK